MRLPNKLAMKGAAVGLALLDAVALQAGTLKIDGLRIVPGTAPQSGSDAFQRGRGLLVLGDVPAALAAFRQAMLADPQSTGALNGIAVCYDRLGRYDISRSYYEAALAIDPNSAVILNNFGYSLYLQGDIETAITHLIAARDADDADVSAASRRTLAMIAAQPHNAEADPSATVQVQPAPVAARIERTSGSEVRLVFGDAPLPRTAAPRRAVAIAATTQPRAAVQMAVAAPVHVAAVAPLLAAPVTPPVELAALITPVAVPLATATAPVAPLPPAAGAALDADVAAAAAVAAAWTPHDDARLVAEQHALDLADAAAAVPVQTATAPPMPPVPAVPAETGEIVLAAATAPARSRPAAAPVALAANSPVGPRPRVLVEPRRETLTPWIVTGQFVRAARPAPATLAAPAFSGGDAVFASDDPVLNEFAARMRRRSQPAGPMPLDRDQAIALLQSIIARVRTS